MGWEVVLGGQVEMGRVGWGRLVGVELGSVVAVYDETNNPACYAEVAMRLFYLFFSQKKTA